MTLVDDFNKDGYVLVNDLFSQDETARLREICDSTPIGVRVDDKEWWTEHITGHQFVDSVVERYQYIAEAIYGGRNNYHCGHVSFKVADSNGGQLAPHFDTPYDTPSHYNDIDSLLCIQGCVLVDDFTVDNGSTMIWPGSHKLEFDYPAVLAGAYNEEFVANGKYIVANQGAALFFHARVLHSTMPNTSSQRRRLMLNLHLPTKERTHG